MKPSGGLVLDPAPGVAFRGEALDLVNRAVCERRADIVAAADGPPLYLEYRLGRALALGFKRIEHVHNIDHFQKPIRRYWPLQLWRRG
jgi:hypothetical protein